MKKAIIKRGLQQPTVISQKRNQSGFTLIELGLVIAIATIMILGGVAWYASTSAAQRKNDAVQDLNAMRTIVLSMFQSQGNFTGLANSVITPASTFPQTLRVPGDATKIKSPWFDDGVDVAPATITSADDAMSLTYKTLQQSACIDFVSAVYTYFEETIVDGTTVTTVPEISGACADDVDVEFITAG